MSKAAKTRSRLKRLAEKRKRKAAQQARYARYAEMGENSKQSKRVNRKKRDWNQPGPRPRETPIGTKPQATRLSTKHKTIEYGKILKLRTDIRKHRRNKQEFALAV